ncbi:hypothetical protein J2X63_001765 [Agromyces sp. 3263]|uniref:hypothetical protein n=1 Tax=Agromyces sp. 3263 TaxID=2817750 RepID=UPI00286193ED|nr:hypothetical protein [Agromyces sp. 3263]MDR6906079.1 hypothetical protein [Agromyces sp. 3263]
MTSTAARSRAIAGVVAAVAIAGIAVIAISSAASSGPEFHADGSKAERVVKGLPKGWEGTGPDLLSGSPTAGWVNEDEFGIVTIGSSSCPPVAGDLQVMAPDQVTISFSPSPHDACTADMAATTHVFKLPPSADGRPLIVTVQNESQGTEYVLNLP